MPAHTLLRTSIDIKSATVDDEYLKKGMEYALKRGVNEALFKVRVLSLILKAGNDRASSFFIGAVLSSEIKSIIAAPQKTVKIGGRAELRRPMITLLRAYSDKKPEEIPDELSNSAVPRGLVRIYEEA